jgi:hypothetical protein
LGCSEDTRGFAASSAVQLLQNYPNPFSLTTTIELSIQRRCDVTLSIYDVIGVEIATLHAGQLLPGHYSFEWDASHLPSGVYVYQFEADDYVRTKKMILLK